MRLSSNKNRKLCHCPEDGIVAAGASGRGAATSMAATFCADFTLALICAVAKHLRINIMEQRYENGSEVRVGDVITYAGQKGAIVFVVDRFEYSDNYPQSDWPLSLYPTGFMIEFTNGALLLLDKSDEDLELLSRST